MLQNYGRKNGRKDPSQKEEGYLPFPLNQHLSSLKSYSPGLPHLFSPPSLLESTFMGCYKTVVFSFLFPFIYSIRTVPQDGKIQPPCPQETNTSLLLKAFKNIKVGSGG